jgi:thiamine-phosphate pyrophosphorylase
MIDLKQALKLCLIIGNSNCHQQNLFEIIQQAIKGGITSLQLREKNTEEKDVANLGKELLKILPAHIPLIINDYVDVAKYLGTAVHLGQSDMGYSQARKKLGKKTIIGISIENINQAKSFQNCDNNYYGIGPIFTTRSKHNAAKPIGIHGLNKILTLLSQKPCIAIGGISLNNIASLKTTNIDGIAVISAVTKANSPYLATHQLITQWNK